MPAPAGLSPLAGRRVLNTRASDDAAALDELIRARGAEPIPFPCLEFAAPSPEETRAVAAAFERARREPPAAIAIASPRAAREFISRARGLAQGERTSRGGSTAARSNDRDLRWPHGALIAASGEATARALREAGFAAIAPEQGVGAEALARLVLERLERDRWVLLPQAAEPSPALAEALRAGGLEPVAAPLYRTVPLEAAGAPHARGLALLEADQLDAVLLGSGSAVRGFAAILRARNKPPPARLRLACIGEPTAAVARGLGLKVDAVGEGGFDSLLAALAACYVA